MTTPHKSFEERVDEVLDDIIGAAVLHVSKMKDHDYDFKYINDRYNEAKAALLALLNEARLDEVLMARELIPTYPNNIEIAVGRATKAGLYFIKRIDELRAEQRTRANLTGEGEES